ncbi:unnamed protein product [Lepeophtheirus salmonis]|uniref:(salmon louse) hypothetical protein n=1 Tax=Lepeophtheirus salmonis TaxID=72036 RepID=A0A7R8HBG9_LEPSM|nr:unnamed protein product [Lepeophtheirus salmonis]CAF2981155.1 unnamed protein product [Lepeophtheirus salmonis]
MSEANSLEESVIFESYRLSEMKKAKKIPRNALMVQSLSQSGTAELFILGNVPQDMELLKAIAAIRTGDRKDVTDKAFTHKKNEFSLINGFHFWESSSCFRFKRPSWISYT